jgi:methionyl-tRNA formyltransferase
VLKIKNINDEEAVSAVQAAEIDWLFIIGWSQIAKGVMLQAPRRGVLGIHPTLLPVGRGRAPIPWAILKGLTETGVTLFQLDEGVDTGPIVAQERLAIAPDETATTLYKRINVAHRTLIRSVLPDLLNDRVKPVAQDSTQATEWSQRTPEDGRITNNMTVDFVDKLVRATTRPYPGAFWEYQGKILRIWRGRVSDATSPVSNGSIRIQLADGAYDALECDFA